MGYSYNNFIVIITIKNYLFIYPNNLKNWELGCVGYAANFLRILYTS